MCTLPVMHQDSVLRNHMLCNNMLRNVGDDVAQHDVAQLRNFGCIAMMHNSGIMSFDVPMLSKARSVLANTVNVLIGYTRCPAQN